MSLLSDIDAVVFDVDGTLLHANDPSGPRGAHPIAGAAETVERVRASGRRVLFFTNGTGRPPVQYAADIRALGFVIADEEFMNPAVVAARWIARRHPGKSVLVLGGPGRRGAVARSRHRDGRGGRAGARRHRARRLGRRPHLCRAASGLRVDLGGRAATGHLDGQRLLRQRRRGSRLVGRDRRGHPADHRSACRHARASRRPVALREACRALGVKPARTLVVGDDLELEIAMARRAGARSALVLTGVGTEAAAAARPPARRPDAILADVTALTVE